MRDHASRGCRANIVTNCTDDYICHDSLRCRHSRKLNNSGEGKASRVVLQVGADIARGHACAFQQYLLLIKGQLPHSQGRERLDQVFDKFLVCAQCVGLL